MQEHLLFLLVTCVLFFLFQSILSLMFHLLEVSIYNIAVLYLLSLQSRSKSLQPSAAPQPPENHGKMSAANHRRHRVSGGTWCLAANHQKYEDTVSNLKLFQLALSVSYLCLCSTSSGHQCLTSTRRSVQ